MIFAFLCDLIFAYDLVPKKGYRKSDAPEEQVCARLSDDSVACAAPWRLPRGLVYTL